MQADNSASRAHTGDPLLAACPSCHGLVRVPEQRLAEHPRCPRCKTEIMPGRPFELTADSFTVHVERASVPVLVDFWAEWCGPCRMVAPVLEGIARRRSAAFQVGKVNVDAEQGLATRFAIRSIPTLMLFRGGRPLARQSGALDADSLERWIDAALAGR